MKIINILIGCALALSVVSCNDFLDVRPKAEKLEKDLFKDAQGFEDAIYGVYGSLQRDSLYGKSLTWGIPEVLAQNLYSTNTSIVALSKYDYTGDADLRKLLSGIWVNAYQTIGYANNILHQLEDWSPSSLPLYNNYKGEMLGVRALLHFDLLRLFASMNMAADGIPYVTTYSYAVKPFSKVGEVYQFILDDLLEAERLLADEETAIVYPHNNSNYNKFENYQETHFNLYAVRALLARVYWMKGDMVNAGKYAENVIKSGKFPLVAVEEIKDYLAGTLSPKETIFGVYSSSYVETCKSYLYNYQTYHSYNPYSNGVQTGGNYPQPYTAVYAMDVPTTSQDFRLEGHFKVGTGYSTFLKTTDYYTIEDNVPESRKELISGITLLHASEMYLIAAEALLESNYNQALIYFDTELKSRGVTPLSQRDTPLTKEIIYNEYRKELFGEGQTWYNMKRLNKEIVSNAESRIIPASDKIYVIPIPAEEYEYRN